MGPRIGLFNYATKTQGGVADFNPLYLSDKSKDAPVSDERLVAAIAYAENLDLSAKACEYQADVRFWLDRANEALERGVFTHPQADAPVERLQLALAEFLAADDAPGDNCGFDAGSVAIDGADAGAPGVGDSLSVAVDGWPEGTNFAYQRLVSDAADGSGSSEIDGAVGASFGVTEDLVDRWIGVRVTATTPDGAEQVEVSSFVDRKSTRLNSSHVAISYAVFCLKKNKYCTDSTELL